MLKETRARVMVFGAGVVTLVLVGGAAYLFGSGQQKSRVEAAETRTTAVEGEVASLEQAHAAQMREASRERSAQQRQIGLLTARRHLAIAIDQLDQRNFGVSEREWRRAAEELGHIEEPEAVRALQTRLADFSLGEGGSFDQAREELREMARAIDAFVEPVAAAAVDTADPAPARNPIDS